MTSASLNHEKEAFNQLADITFDYMLKREASDPDKILVDLKTYYVFLAPNIPSAEQSNMVYLPVIDKHADTTEAMEAIVSKLHKEYGIGIRADSLGVVGDQKTYTWLQELKYTYGSNLDWLIPFVGDWHVLKNFQSVLMNVYYEAGLKDLAEAAGFCGETLTSLKKCSNFKRTHTFLLQCWEALYRHMIASFLSTHFQDTEKRELFSAVKRKLAQCGEATSPDQLFHLLMELRAETAHLPEDFLTYVTFMASKDSNWKFWKDFVLYHAFSYICLFLSTRGGVWKLRLAGIKCMAPLFAAFDRTHYQKIIPQHLSELLLMPKEKNQ